MPRSNQPKNDEKFQIHNQYFGAGISIDPKLAVANSFYKSQALDFRSKPSQMDVLPQSRQLATNLTDLITCMTQDLNGVRYGTGTNGGFYRIDTSNNVQQVGTLPTAGAAGIFYNQLTDQVYMSSQKSVGIYGQVTSGATGNPVFRSSNFAHSASTGFGTNLLYDTNDGLYDGDPRNNLQTFTTGVTDPTTVTTNVTTGSYALTVVLNEQFGSFTFFQPDIEPFRSIAVYVVTPGTGDWTLTLHDSFNNVMATVTITNANLIANQYNNFIFSGQVRAIVNASGNGNGLTAPYHFHLTSTVADGTAGSLTDGDASGIDFILFAHRLVTTQNGWHPMTYFFGGVGGTNILCVGNAEYLSTYDFSQDNQPTNGAWQRHALQFGWGEEVCGLATTTQYLVIATERRSTSSSRMFQDGKLYFWDGSTTAPNFFIDVPMGAPYGLFSFNNVVYFVASGSLYAWSGGQTIIKVRQLSYQQTDYLGAVDTTLVNPNMFTSRYNLMLMAYPSSATNPNLTPGIWSWGTVELTFPNSLGLSYVQSPGLTSMTSSNGYQIGMCETFVDTTYSSWQYTDSNSVVHYGLDVIDNFSTPAPNFSWLSLIYDGGVVYKTKQAYRMKVKFLPLPAGCTIQAQYSINRGAFVTSPSANAGDTAILFDIDSGRFHEIQWGFVGTCSSSATAPPIITGVTMEIGPLEEEQADLRAENNQ